MIRPQVGDEGRQVIYNAGYPGAKGKVGILHSWNEHYVFVWYNIGSTAQATSRENLTWASSTKRNQEGER